MVQLTAAVSMSRIWTVGVRAVAISSPSRFVRLPSSASTGESALPESELYEYCMMLASASLVCKFAMAHFCWMMLSRISSALNAFPISEFSLSGFKMCSLTVSLSCCGFQFSVFGKIVVSSDAFSMRPLMELSRNAYSGLTPLVFFHFS